MELKKIKITQLRPPRFRPVSNSYVTHKWECFNHPHLMKRRSISAMAESFDLAYANSLGHMQRYHAETHRCRHCNAAREQLVVQRTMRNPVKPWSILRVYVCERCNYRSEFQMGSPDNSNSKYRTVITDIDDITLVLARTGPVEVYSP